MAGTSWAVFTDLDGTLFDAHTDDALAAKPLLQRLSTARVPVVPITDRTFDQMAPLIDELSLSDAMIVEGGACVALLRGEAWHLERFGPDADTMLDVIRQIELLSGSELSVYSVMSPQEAHLVTGLRGEALVRSQNRVSDEPFVITRGRASDVATAARKLGFVLQREGALFHVATPGSRATAFDFVRRELQCRTTIALGDSVADGEFLALADVAIIVPRADGAPDRELVQRVPGARVALAPGTVGWDAAVDDAWSELKATRQRRGTSRSDQRPSAF